MGISTRAVNTPRPLRVVEGRERYGQRDRGTITAARIRQIDQGFQTQTNDHGRRNILVGLPGISNATSFSQNLVRLVGADQ